MEQTPRKELAAGLAGLRDAAGVAPSEDAELDAPLLLVRRPIDDVVARVADLLQAPDGRWGLFRRGRELGTISQETGEFVPMSARNFRTWLPRVRGVMPVEKYLKSVDDEGRETKRPMKGELTLDQAATILESDLLRVRMPVLENIHAVKMPVLRTELDERGEERRKGFRKLELLPQGYDKQSRTYTIQGGLDFPDDMDPTEASEHLAKLLQFFPWGDPGRSRAIQLAAMMTIFCARLFSGRSPMVLWNANLPDSGKSRLAQLAIQPVHGRAGRSGFSYEDKTEVRKSLDAVAQDFGAYVFFDDVPRGKVRSEDLHRWLTAPEWSCRVMGTKERFTGQVQAATMMTGNQVKLNDDLERRTLIIDLFSRVKGSERVLPDQAIILDDDYFADEQHRSRLLAALWAQVRWWDDQGRPPAFDAQRQRVRLLNSFEGWSRVVPAIVSTAGFGNCLEPYNAPDGGNEEGRELERLIRAVIRELMPPRPEGLASGDAQEVTITLQEVVAVARRNKLLQDILWTVEAVLETEDEKGGFKVTKKCPEFVDEHVWRETQAACWMNPSMRSKFGKLFKHGCAGGRFWRADNGDVVEVGSRASNDLAKIRLRRMP